MYGTELLSKVAIDKKTKPTVVESILYLFWDKGISYNEFKDLPLPYIFSILRAYEYTQKKQEKEMKDSQRKRNGRI